MAFSESQSLYLSLTMEDEDLNSGGYRGLQWFQLKPPLKKCARP